MGNCFTVPSCGQCESLFDFEWFERGEEIAFVKLRSAGHGPLAEVRRNIQAVAAEKLNQGDRVLISGLVPSELQFLRHFHEEIGCYRLELDPDLPVESFYQPTSILRVYVESTCNLTSMTTHLSNTMQTKTSLLCRLRCVCVESMCNLTSRRTSCCEPSKH